MRVAIIDYGVGNIFSLQRALEFLGAEVIISSDADVLSKEKKIILPGVGAFEKGMLELKKRGLDKVIHQSAKNGNSILGICLGMQLLMSKSFENGEFEGLNLIEGEVHPFPKGHDKIPHVGWNQLIEPSQEIFNTSFFTSIKSKTYVYFVHSYMVVPKDETNIVSLTEYAGISYCSAIKRDNIFGCQFHPELSSKAGLDILKAFLTIS